MASSNTSPELEIFLEQLRNVSDPAQLAQGLNSEPQLMVEALRTLTRKYSLAATYEEDLESANRKIRELEQTASSSARSQRRQQPNEELLSRLAELLSSRPPSPQKSPLLPDSQLFSGDKKDFVVWKSSILLKLNINADHFPSEQTKMAYIYSRLNGTSQSHLQSFLENGLLTFPSVTHMLRLLSTLFDDPNRARDAAARLHSNYQRNRPFVNWISEVRRDAALAGYDPNSTVLRNLIFFNMSIELKRAIIHERDIDMLDINETISRLQDIDNRQRTLTNLLSRNNNSTSTPFRTPNAPKPPPTPQSDDAMDLSTAETQRRGPLSKEEKDRRRRLGLCNYCGEKGHLVRSCPTRPQQVGRAVDLFEEDSISESGNV